MATAAVEPNLNSGIYQLSVTDARGCETIADVTIGQPATPVSVQSIQIDQGCAGTSENEVEATASGGTGNTYTFSWNDPLQQSTPIANGLDSSTYIVTAMDTNGCTGADTINSMISR